MQIRHVGPGDDAQLARLLGDHERHYGYPVREGSGAAGAAFLIAARTAARSACLGAQRFHDRLGLRCEKKVHYVMDGW